MKPTLQRKGSKAQAGRLASGTSQVKKGTNRQKGSAQKASATDVLSRKHPVNKPPTETRKEVATLELKKRQIIDPSTKIKLQLFPVDEVTRIGLEKDGLNPFLELTLRARKKISSVINHIHTKWGSSKIAATGNPMLLPYESHLRSSRWTSKDTSITAGDVYTAVKSPAIFRLSYGWFSDYEASRVSSETGPHNCVTSESMQKEIENEEERKLPDATAEADDDTYHVDTKVNIGQSHDQSTSPWEDELTNLSIGGLLSQISKPQNTCIHTDISIGGLLSEASLQGKLNNNHNQQQTPLKWDDVTALSIGGLLSEVSMQAKMRNKSDSKSFISDSLDASAVISSQPKNDPQFSILDAEQTCHAFSFRKLSNSSKNVRVTVKASQDSSTNSFKFPGLLLQGDREVEDNSGTEPKPELFSNPQQYIEDSRSLGLRGINWNESLGPFDLGNSMPWKI